MMAVVAARSEQAAESETLVREYRSGREYTRDAARLQRAGWEVVSVLERPARRRALGRWVQRATGGRAGALFPPDVERLVTYVWRGRGPRPATGELRWRGGVVRPRRGLRRRMAAYHPWWLVLVAVLVLLLVVGLVSFLGDGLLTGVVALAV